MYRSKNTRCAECDNPITKSQGRYTCIGCGTHFHHYNPGAVFPSDDCLSRNFTEHLRFTKENTYPDSYFPACDDCLIGAL